MDIPIYYINNLEDIVIEILFRFHELSEDDFIFHGVTGTNGKTTTAFMAHNIMRELQKPSIYIGTLGAIINDDLKQTKGNTTPGIFELFEILQACTTKQKTYVFLEISSHALVQKRLCNLLFLQTIILNIQSDHLDYHKTERNYINAKLSIANLNNQKPTIISIDQMQDLLPRLSKVQKEQLAKAQFLSSKNPSAPFKYSFDYNPEGSSKIDLNFPSLALEASVTLFLKFNIENYIAAIALISEHVELNDLNNTNRDEIKLPQGRGEILRLKKGKILIDYAHDQQSMQNILSELDGYHNDIILVFGCGGDRDKSKRSKMMKVAQDFSNKVFFTSDNNRYEPFSVIASDAMNESDQAGVEIIEDRKKAINSALQHLTKENILVILGKGHETSMEISGKKIPFNDRDCVLEILGNEIN
jgi:UDP-N-acetylmuramyl-tripeptide synthetase